jgi:hypothetical protein
MGTIEKMQKRLRKMAKKNPALMYAIKKADDTVSKMSPEDMKKELEEEGIDFATLKERKIKKIFKKR